MSKSAITKADAKTHQAFAIAGNPVKHLQPLSNAGDAVFVINEPASGKIMDREFTAGILIGGGFMVEFKPAEGDDVPLGWDRYLLDFNDVIGIVAAEMMRERALRLRVAAHAAEGSVLYRCGRHIPAMLRDDAGQPISGVSDAPFNGCCLLYLMEDATGTAWTYLVVSPDGALVSVAWPRPPSVPRWKWVA